MTKTHFEQLSDLNVDFFESAKKSLLDPTGLYLANDVKWIKLNENWNSLKFPVVMGGKGIFLGFPNNPAGDKRIIFSIESGISKASFKAVEPPIEAPMIFKFFVICKVLRRSIKYEIILEGLYSFVAHLGLKPNPNRSGIITWKFLVND